MRRALELAARGRGLVSPNPLVGAVLLRDGVLMGEGFHAGPGQLHAEVIALREAGEAARGGTLYVTLEPCRHHGRTPPCTEAITAAGVARVVFAARDPHPEAGGGAATLEAAGITVERGLLRDEAVDLNAPFLWRVAAGRPFVILKFAQSLDGRIAAGRGQRTPLTGEAARADVYLLRAGVDAVLVGRNTVATDDPLLTSRGGRDALRVVLDSEASLAPTSRLAATVGNAPVLVVTGPEAPAKRKESLRALGVEVDTVPRAPNDGLDPAAVLDLLGARGMNSVLVEGGAEVAHSFLEAGLVERFVQYVAPVWLGEAGVQMFGPVAATGTGGGNRLWSLADVSRVGEDARLTWERRAAFDALREAA